MADTSTAEETQETPQAQEAQAEQPAAQDGSVDVHEAELPEAQAQSDASASTGGGQIDILLDSTMPIEVCLGRAEMTVGQLLQLGPGSVIKLDKLAGEPVELLLRNVQFATGTLVVVGDQLGVKIKEIVSAQEEAAEGSPAA